MNQKIYEIFANCGVLNDFPFPIDDFDKLTQYEMLLKCISTIKKLCTNDTTLTNRIDALYNFVTNYFENLNVQDEINQKLDEMIEDGTLQSYVEPYFNDIIEPQIIAQNKLIESQNTTIENFTNEINNKVETQDVKIDSNENNIDVLKGRVDELSQLPSGSTSGDAELIDIRTSYNGVVYPSAGDSVRGQVSAIYGTIGKKMEIKNPINWYNGDTAVYDKYVNKAGEEYDNEDYRYVTMKVTAGDVLRFYRFYDNVNRYGTYQARFICAYDINGDAVELSGAENSLEYTVPADIVKLAISIKDENTKPLITKNTIYKPIGEQNYFTPYYIATNSFNNKSIQNNKTNNKLKISGTNLASGQTALLPKNNIAKNKIVLFNGTFNNFNSFKIYRKKDNDIYNTITIDSTKITITNTINNYSYEYTHGLTITNDIEVIIENKPNNEVVSSQTENYDYKVTLISNGVKYSTPYVDINSPQSYDDLIISPISMTFLTYSFALLSNDFKANTYIFGDSYVTLNNARWIWYLAEDGKLDNVLINAYSGENSYRAELAFENIKTMGNPKYLLWSLGMNDSDDGAVNPNWQYNLNQVATYCLNNDIDLILCTLPNTPTRSNVYKNDFVKQSGYRYIDFVSAVQSSEGASSWKDGMLSDDNVHPTQKGAIALYTQVLKDFPEIMEK